MVDRMLILVRHAMPAATPESPPDAWELSDDGARSAASLRALLPRDARLAASTEPKAWQTLGGPDDVELDSRFCEVARPEEPWSDDFRTRRAAYVAGTVPPGWETHESVATRFADGVNALGGGARPVVVASHGMAITVWLTSIGVIGAESAEAFWRELRFPDAHLVDLDAQTVRRWPPLAQASA
jgi:broad specificity phosphatase PhoE